MVFNFLHPVFYSKIYLSEMKHDTLLELKLINLSPNYTYQFVRIFILVYIDEVDG